MSQSYYPNRFIICIASIMLGLNLHSTLAFAETSAVDYSQFTNEQFDTLTSIKKSFTEIEDFQTKGALTSGQANGAKAYILIQQQARMQDPIALPKLEQLVASCDSDERCRQKTLMDQFRGVFSFINIIWFIASVLILLGLLAVIVNYKRTVLRLLRPLHKLFKQILELIAGLLSVILPLLAKFLRSIPTFIYELIALAFSLLLVYSAQLFNIASQAYIAFMGSVLAMLILNIIFNRHRVEIGEFYQKYYVILRHRPHTLLMFLSTAIWAVPSVVYHSQLLGFFTIAIILTWLGFGLLVTPLSYAFGFRNRKTMIRGTVGAFVLLAVYVTLEITQLQFPYYKLFEPGIKYLGAFVFYCGLLISASKWSCKYYEFNYRNMQIITIAAGVLTLYIGSVYELSALRGIGGTFFALYLIEKQFEFPWSKKRAAWFLLLLGITLYAIAQTVSIYPEYFFMAAE